MTTIRTPRRGGRSAALLLAASSLVVAGAQLGTATAAHASTTNDTVMATTQRMTGPTLNTTQVGWYGRGSHLNLQCYSRGQSVKGYYSPWIPGGWDNLWYKVSDGYWVADVDINTGSDNPVTPACGTSTSTGRYNAGIISAASHYANGVYGGQCLVFVETLIRAAGGPSLAFGYSVSTYQSQWAAHATQVSWAQAAPGDIIQWYDPNGQYGPVHTAVLTSGNSESSATVVDSNYGIPLNQERVGRGSFASRNIGFHAGTYKIWRVN